MNQTFEEKTLGERMVLAAWTAVHLHLARQQAEDEAALAAADASIDAELFARLQLLDRCPTR